MESFIEDDFEPPITSAQAQELDQRLKGHERHPEDVVDWETIKAELDSRFGREPVT